MRPPEVVAERQEQMRAATRRGRGRPRFPLDALQIFELAQLGLSNRQIAAQLGCNHKTLRRFSADLERARLRRRALSQIEHMHLIQEDKSWAALKAQLKQWTVASGKSGTKGKPVSGEK